MFTYTYPEIAASLTRAKNLNAAIKKFIKHEGRAGGDTVKFAKEVKATFVDRRAAGGEKLFERYLPKYENHLLLLAAYAHADFVQKTVNQIIDQYADAFNSTYERSEQGVNVTNQAEFSRIVKASFEIINAELKAYEFADCPFMKNVVMISIFDMNVIPEVFKVVR